MNAYQKLAVVLAVLFVATITVLFTASGAILAKIFVVLLVLLGFALLYVIGSWLIDAHEFAEYQRREVEYYRRNGPFGRPMDIIPGRPDLDLPEPQPDGSYKRTVPWTIP